MRYKNNLSSVLIPVFTLGIILLAWQFLAGWFKVPEYILPRPTGIIEAYAGMGGELKVNFFTTLEETVLGLLLGSAIGFIMGVLIAQSTLFKKMSLPFLIATNAVPVIAVAPIIIIWFGNSILAKIVVCAFISFFPIALNSYKGLSEYAPYYRELFMVYGASETEFLFKYKMKNALPFILTGLKLNATLSVIGAVIGEFVSSDRGLGFAILQSSYNFNSPKLWAYILLTCVIGVCLYAVIYILEKTIFKQFKPNVK